jgi:TolB-like protein/class 3 adenylate cyclase/Tfp pilus assembly protein PilF
MSAEVKTELELEIAHILFIDTVGYSKLLINEQRDLLDLLNQVVRSSECFRRAETAGTLIRLPTGDGMALVFSDNIESPLRCALEIGKALRNCPQLPVRMGIHSGPVSHVVDVNDRTNVAGAGINVAQRVMSCGDSGHILLSKRAAEDIAHYRHWQPFLHDLGECEAKHGIKLNVVNLYTDEVGNKELPACFKQAGRKGAFGSRPRSNSSDRDRKIAIAFILALALAAMTYAVFRYSKGREEVVASAIVPDKSIAVLPFANLSKEEENAFFADGVQNEILTDLAKVADLKVISRVSVGQYKSGVARNLREIATALGVAHVLEGSVQRAGGRVRVNAQLVDARTDAHIWAESYDRELADVFAIQSEIAQKIADQLKAKLSASERAAIAEQPTSDLVAYDRYLRAKVLLDSTTFSSRARENLLQAVRFLNDAVASDPSFFLAYYELASANDRLYFLGIEHTPERLALGDAALQTLLRMRPDAGETHLARAQHLYRGYLDYDQAHDELAVARVKLPNNPLVYELAGYIERRQGRWEQSTRDLERALELDPRNSFVLQQLSLTYQNLRRFADAAAVLDRALKLAPEDIETRVARAQVEFEWRANIASLRATIDDILAENPAAGQTIAERLLLCALCERDAAALDRVMKSIPAPGVNENGVNFPRSWCEGLAARLRGDTSGARTAFLQARTEVDKIVQAQPDYARALAVLGMIDGALGRKEDALREAKRAVELLPVNKDALNGAYMLRYMAITCAWIGEKDLAFKQLRAATDIPGDVTYGQLRLHPNWDSLRGDARFDALVKKLSPPGNETGP